ncbi:MAG: aspartate aminotransferase family protein [Firmicutes bacterium]|nr:aspartate aminotransferase family protein [Bacillota bacterium]
MERRSFEERFNAQLPNSKILYNRALQVLPSGVTHDARYLAPFPPYIARASGSKKWDVDGNEYVDYWMGHGALLLGHAHPKLVQAVQEQVAKGTHLGGCHELEIRWAELISQLMPAAEKVRFVGSGTEATHLAMRLARAFTGRTKTIKFAGHFHGWHDAVTGAVVEPDEDPAPGVLRSSVEATISLPPNDVVLVEDAIKEDGDVAAVIVEPGGGSWGTIPTTAEFLRELRRVTADNEVVLIFDEVVTGFRLAPGGAQEYYGVVPDLVCLAKVVAGGLPGGAVAGRREIMELLEFKDDLDWNRRRKIPHQGTFNANPLSAAAGVAVLEEVAKGDCIRQANGLCGQLADGMNEVLQQAGIPGQVYVLGSMFHIALEVEPADADYKRLVELAKGPKASELRRAMLLEGVDLMRNGGFLSAAHTAEDIDKTIEAFAKILTSNRRMDR